ncbi:MAG: hypothetical protein KAW09_10205, partial [Thermoplasmata archaeon]|nr:hypothetical protein [Thermoplasmata archaeon]
YYHEATIGGKETRTEGAVICVLVMLVAYAFSGVVATDSHIEMDSEMNSLEKFLAFRSDVVESGEDDPMKISSLDSPYILNQDDGTPTGDYPGDSTMLVPPYCVSDTVCNNIFGGSPFELTDGGGDFLVGGVSESWLGDQNGNGNIEWVVFYFYIPWMNDTIDNDGDGCVDEAAGVCDPLPDAMVIYETGFYPKIGGDDGTLLMNLDYYSFEPTIELYRVFVSTRWQAYQVRGVFFYPQIEGEFVSYYSEERLNSMNANPEMDNDYDDWYVGNIDARGFPSRPPVDHACAAGYQHYTRAFFERSDGWLINSFELREYYDNHDWNEDGDIEDRVAAYYSVGPSQGNCRESVVNTGVSGRLPTNSGALLTPKVTFEASDGRDWDSNSYLNNVVRLYHDINSTWNLRGKAYTSFTFTTAVPAWGFGWWALCYMSSIYDPFPLKFGVGFQVYDPQSSPYKTYFVLTADEDGDRHTYLPQYRAGYGVPKSVQAGVCMHIGTYEY